MRKIYEIPVAEMVEIASEDIICTSNFIKPDNTQGGEDLDDLG